MGRKKILLVSNLKVPLGPFPSERRMGTGVFEDVVGSTDGCTIRRQEPRIRSSLTLSIFFPAGRADLGMFTSFLVLELTRRGGAP